METLNDVKFRFKRSKFIKNAFLTMIINFGFDFPQAMAILVKNNKNAKRWKFKNKQSYIDYLGN